ncbi:2OG-Fe(II) oxygenase [Thalassolituus oleivorans]|uniref:2OG-Fe(II) oxygenase n=1 Tax=Thalassolituus oleivorans TaxID=187493 RepID=UPI001CE28CEF|nr:2OG-Fe(II) oxygenase [Thalassolituus oleivorans]MCA6128155.1 proline hydroxylase [Thalassolituus oleivorans 4BN06-13]
MHSFDSFFEPPFERIAEDLSHRGYAVIDCALPDNMTLQLAQRLLQLIRQDDDSLQAAGIGRGDQHAQNRFVRQDKIRWLEQADEAEKAWLDYMSELRAYLNRRLFLGLFSYESHFAHYQPGAFYKKHLDAFRGQANRVLSTVLYLNNHWQASDGGELLIYNEDNQLIETVIPAYGRLVVFLSEEFPHEVKPAQRDRYSIAGWFRVNTSNNDKVDPPR